MNKVMITPEMAAEKLWSRRDLIIEDFIRTCQAEMETASRVQRHELANCLPMLLDYLGRCLVDSPKASEHLTEIGKDHGRTRGRDRHFDMKDLILEYRILSRIVFLHLRHNAEVSEAAQDKIYDSLLRAFGNAIAVFTEIKDFTLKTFLEDSRDRLARALELGQKELESFFMSAHCPMFMTVGKLHRVTLANEAMARVLGRDVTGERLEKGPLFDGLETVANSGRPYYYERASFPQGHHFNIYLHPHFETSGAFKGTMGLLEDVNSSLARPGKIFIEVRHQH